MNKEIVIIGAGGHGRVVADIARLCGYDNIAFLDDAEIPDTIGKVSDYVKYISTADFFVAIGNSSIRERIQNELLENGCSIVTLIHSNATIGSNVSIGKGTVVMAGAVINTETKIGDGVIINTSSSVDHNCIVEDFCHVSVGAHLAGTVSLGKHTMIGAGATVINNIDVCENCTIGAGATVIKDITIRGIYTGLPAVLNKRT